MSAQKPQEQPQEQPQEEIKCPNCKVGAHGVCAARLPGTETLPPTPCCCGATGR